MANGDNSWPELAALVKSRPSDQRRILRPHVEGRFAREVDSDARKRREELDRELDKITRRELRVQSGSKQTDDYAPIPHFETLLQDSPAFVQYLNYYLYFGVRFAAGRIAASSHCPGSPSDNSGPSDCNQAPVGLPAPPLCRDASFDPNDLEEFLTEVVDKDSGDPCVSAALAFLDGFRNSGEDNGDFELWVRGLYFRQPNSSFPLRSTGLLLWAKSRYDFFTKLEANGGNGAWVNNWESEPWCEGRWRVENPLAARCAIADFYWLARILRAEVSPRGLVSYPAHSWLHLLAMRQPLVEPDASPATEPGVRALLREGPLTKDTVLRWEEVLRAVFAYACDVVQNAVEIAEDREDQPPVPPPPDANRPWRAVYDKEQEEIRAQRKEWRPDAIPAGAPEPDPDRCPETDETKGWSRRVWTGEHADNLIGIALSGGGIRSATFNLGVLQRLQELDILRRVDYLSTVSGGGYIGAWLIGNVRRTRYWLSRMTSWDKSIEHLRRYSDYLAPDDGILSADTWTMWGTWVRNALLLQSTAFVWVALLLIFVLSGEPLFESIGKYPAYTFPARVSLAGLMVVIASILSFYLWRLARRPTADPAKGLVATIISWGDWLPTLAAGLAWLGSFLAAALLWGQANQYHKEIQEYGWILANAWQAWPLSIRLSFVGSLVLIVRGQYRSLGFWRSALTVAGGSVTAYLALCAVLRLYSEFLAESAVPGVSPARAAWLAYALGPTAVIVAAALGMLIFIGFIGRDSKDSMREWWTRYGARIGIAGAGVLAVASSAIFLPQWVSAFVHASWWASVKAGAVLAWLGSVITGLLAGKSDRTGVKNGQTSNVLQWMAYLGGLIFIVGAVALSSSLIHVTLHNVLKKTGTEYWGNLSAFVNRTNEPLLVAIALGLLGLGLLFSWRFDLNTFGLNQFYRNRLVRCYLGATRWQPGMRKPHLFTGFDDRDDLPLSSLRCQRPEEDATNADFCQESFRGPLPIVNCTLNLGGSSDLAVHTRHSASFFLTPLYCGALRKPVGFAPTPRQKWTGAGFASRVTLGQAISVSGAAASPNMGYNTSPLVSFLLTLFNVRLGWWFPNPGKPKWDRDGPLNHSALIKELFGLADENGDFINVSDGGHFENLGIYELVRRRARVIIAADAECDGELAFGSLGNVIRICETDFGAKIDIDVSSIRKDAQSGLSHSHCAVGKIIYSNGALGYLIYIKSSLTSDEDVGIAQYHSAHPAFPHESTVDQFFSEDQFEAYRRLGHHIAERTFRGAENEGSDMVAIAAKLFDLWAPSACSSQAFLTHAKTFNDLWERFRTDPKLADLFKELTGLAISPAGSLEPAEIGACMELTQLMENVFLDLRLDDFWDRPDNRGWAMLFSMWARSPKFHKAWTKVRHTYGIRFEYFCDRNLGLDRDRPVMRV